MGLKKYNIFMMHNLNCVYQNIDVRLCTRSYSDAVNAHIFNYYSSEIL